MLGLGLASSHAPALFCPAEAWPTVYDAIPDYMKDSQPHTAKLETPEVIRELWLSVVGDLPKHPSVESVIDVDPLNLRYVIHKQHHSADEIDQFRKVSTSQHTPFG